MPPTVKFAAEASHQPVSITADKAINPKNDFMRLNDLNYLKYCLVDDKN